MPNNNIERLMDDKNKSSSSATSSDSTRSNKNINEVKTIVPKLGEILNDQIEPEMVYSKINFLKFLVDKHCIENYDFYIDLKAIISNYDLLQHHGSTMEWFSFYTQFIESEIINLPADITLRLYKNTLPCINFLKQIEKIILKYLLSSYYEFISYSKGLLSVEKNKTSSCSTSITNNTEEANSCFTNSKSLSPDSSSLCSDIENINNNNIEAFQSYCYTKENNNISEEDLPHYCCHHECHDDNEEGGESELITSKKSGKNSSESNCSTVTDGSKGCKCCDDCPKGNKDAWSKLTKKFKWRRKSSSS